MCVWRGATARRAFGRTSASARMPLWSHAGLLAPTRTSAGIVAPPQAPASRRRLERKRSAGGEAEHAGRSPGLADERVEILDLPVHRIGGCVGARAAPAAVVREDGEALREMWGK